MIFTLNAQGNVLLPVIADYFDLTDEQCAKAISDEFSELKRKLQAKGIDYSQLKSALIPVHKGKQETVFIFDSSRIQDSWYGEIIFDVLLPVLNKESTYSILCGDIIADRLPIELIKNIIFENLVPVHQTTFIHPTQYFAIYINNLSNMQQTEIVKALSHHEFFIGYVDMTFSSRLKTILSYSLVNLGIKHRETMILPHEEDRADQENINLCGYNFERYGFYIKSINELYFDLFLSYKIEAFFPDLDDLRFSMISISPNAAPVLELPISVLEEKLSYLKREKAGIMEKLCIENISTKDLAQLIKRSIQKSYLYNLEYLREYNVPKFNVSLELPTTQGSMRKVVVALKYSTSNNQLELITMY